MRTIVEDTLFLFSLSSAFYSKENDSTGASTSLSQSIWIGYNIAVALSLMNDRSVGNSSGYGWDLNETKFARRKIAHTRIRSRRRVSVVFANFIRRSLTTSLNSSFD